VNTVYKILKKSEPVVRFLRFFRSGKTPLYINGLAGALASSLAAVIHDQTNLPLLLITSGPSEAEAALDDLTTILGTQNVGSLPPMYHHHTGASHPATGPRNERADALLRLKSGESTILVTQPDALIERCPDKKWLDEHYIDLKQDDDCPRDWILSKLVEAGYGRESLVDAQGQFAVRGGLLDIFPFGQEQPFRLELDGNQIASIRFFDPTTQRSTEQLNNVSFLLGEESTSIGSGLFDLLPEKMLIFWQNFGEIEERCIKYLKREDNLPDLVGRSKLSGDYFKPNFLSFDIVRRQASSFREIIWSGLIKNEKVAVDFGAVHPEPLPAGLDKLTDYLESYLKQDLDVWIAVDTEGERNRLEELLQDFDLKQVKTVTPSVSNGFVSKEIGLALLTAHEIFNRRRLRSRHTRFRKRAIHFDRSALRKGDLVVHTDYGIGIYEGLQTVKVRSQPRECLRIRYQEDVKLFVRVENFGQVEKYAGSDSAKPQLSRIGTKEWARAKNRTSKALQDISAELIKLYARRKVIKGYAFPEDTNWQQEMEASFEFEDTPDQVTSTQDVKVDLMASHPMDRLLCGDVGFGKTEIAIRAAFKVVQDSQQVAILVPTTILAQQHEETFSARLSTYPVRIKSLSRFKTPAEQREIVKEMKTGSVDIVIGTHRLLSKDIGFKKLGLLVIDEEHRFGVKHKEKLKQLKTNVDVLTMTATPIPRTLHFALMGARDTSLINTPPMNRLPVQTEIHSWSEDLIREAIIREVDRGGQVFFVHNRVQSIHSVQGMLERIAPGIRYAIAHGQMQERALEKVMTDFLKARFDVLITTMIIESGLDLPNVNTLIINRADRFGLAQLYQLRGRIGRSNRQAYAYLLTPPMLSMTTNSKRRLATISELTELGSGMKVAMRDLEIRGAGNLLGAQQSGYINAVGFDLYSKMLEVEVNKLREQPEKQPQDHDEEIKLDFNGPALLPSSYIDDSDQRYEFYRRLTELKEIDQISMLAEELKDRFGDLPEPAGNLLELTKLKILCQNCRIRKLEIKKDYFVAELKLPEDPSESQKVIGELVALASPEQVEFRVRRRIELIYRLEPSRALQRARKFLQRLTRNGIF
jgi:transcription-repair coupling factor (superfamily II helicase)